MKKLVTAVMVIALFAGVAMAQSPSANSGKEKVVKQTLFKNVKVFNGIDDKLIAQDVLVEANLIKEIGKELKVSEGATVIDGGGRTLMPGLTDAHTHLMINDAPHISIYEKTWAYVGAQAVAGAKAMLLRGFTTVRDVGGPVGGLKDAIDEGLVEGPRVLPSGPFISQTSGHGDLETSAFKLSPYFTGIPDKAAIMGWAYVADGVPEVQKAAREVLRTGATQIKVMAGGGVSSYYDPLDTIQYTLEEMRAMVVEAEFRLNDHRPHFFQCILNGIQRIIIAGNTATCHHLNLGGSRSQYFARGFLDFRHAVCHISPTHYSGFVRNACEIGRELEGAGLQVPMPGGLRNKRPGRQHARPLDQPFVNRVLQAADRSTHIAHRGETAQQHGLRPGHRLRAHIRPRLFIDGNVRGVVDHQMSMRVRQPRHEGASTAVNNGSAFTNLEFFTNFFD